LLVRALNELASAPARAEGYGREVAERWPPDNGSQVRYSAACGWLESAIRAARIDVRCAIAALTEAEMDVTAGGAEDLMRI
jgi:hypothetical protein